MNRFSIISILVLATIVTSCDYPIAMDYFEVVWIECDNNSDSDVWLSYDAPLTYTTEDPVYEVKQYSREYNSEKIQSVVCYANTRFNQVKKKASYTIFSLPTKNGWKYVKKYDYHDDSLRIQVWDDALIQKVGWDEFVQGYGQKYKYELEYIIDLGYFTKDNHSPVTITYPPSGTEDYMRIVYP